MTICCRAMLCDKQRYSYNGMDLGTTWGCYVNDLVKYSMTQSIARPLCDSGASRQQRMSISTRKAIYNYQSSSFPINVITFYRFTQKSYDNNPGKSDNYASLCVTLFTIASSKRKKINKKHKIYKCFPPNEIEITL